MATAAACPPSIRSRCATPARRRSTSPRSSMVEAFEQILRNTALTLQMEALLIPSISVLLKRRGSTLLDLQRFMNDQRNGDLVRLGERSDNPAQRLFFRDRFYAKTFDPRSGGWPVNWPSSGVI